MPPFSLDAPLKGTNINPELPSDPDMYKFFESGVCGGLSVITKRYAKANNPVLPDYNLRYDTTSPSW